MDEKNLIRESNSICNLTSLICFSSSGRLSCSSSAVLNSTLNALALYRSTNNWKFLSRQRDATTIQFTLICGTNKSRAMQEPLKTHRHSQQQWEFKERERVLFPFGAFFVDLPTHQRPGQTERVANNNRDSFTTCQQQTQMEKSVLPVVAALPGATNSLTVFLSLELPTTGVCPFIYTNSIYV